MGPSRDIPLFLASRSPRRRSLLEEWGIPYSLAEPGAEGNPPRGISPFETVLSLARGKCLGASLPERREGPALVLSADTLVVSPEGRLLGKPGNRREASRFLRLLSGRIHMVITGVWARILPGDHPGKGGVETTLVRFRPLEEEEIASYLEGGEWRGKAGAYAVQGEASRFVAALEGERENVVGLPKGLTLFLLESLGGPWKPAAS